MAMKGRYQDLNVYQDKSLTVSDYSRIYNTLAKRVNQRLVRLERSGAKTGSMAAVGYLRKIGRRRFKEKNIFTELSDFKTIKKEITIMQSFLESKRTTKTGRKQILKKTSKTMSQEYDLDLDDESMDSFLSSFEDAKAASYLDSDTIISILASTTNEKITSELVDDIIKEIKNSGTLAEAAEKVAELPGVDKSAIEILSDILG